MNHPGFFTTEFHLRFLPALLAKKWHDARHPPQRSPFSGHVPLELTLMPMACIFLIVLGAPGAIDRSILGLLLSLAGAAGLVLLLVMALKSTFHEPVSYEAFSASVFFFIVLLGASAGILYSTLRRNDIWMELERSRAPALLWALGGAAAGYPLGIFAGLLNQKLGFLAFLPVLVARLGMIGLIVTDLVLLFGRR